MKKICSLLMIAMLALSSVTLNSKNVSAEEFNNEYVIEIDENGEEVLVSDDGYKHHFFMADGTPISAREYLELMNENNNEENYVSLASDTASPNSVVITGKRKITKDYERVTPNYKGPVTITYLESRTFTDSFSYNISGTVKTKFIAEVSATLGLAWTKSVASTTSVSATYNVPSGKTGYIRFAPIYIRVSAVYYDTRLNATYFTGETPEVLGNGFVNGYYDLAFI